jgi:hypothetical protein
MDFLKGKSWGLERFKFGQDPQPSFHVAGSTDEKVLQFDLAKPR